MLEAWMARATHPNRAVEDALRHAEANEWRVQVGGSHAWGKIYCPYNDEECRCGESVSYTHLTLPTICSV